MMIAIYFDLYKLATMNLSGGHPPPAVDNTDTLYLGDHHCQRNSVGFLT